MPGRLAFYSQPTGQDGFSPALVTFIQPFPDLGRIVEANPFHYGSKDGGTLYIAFLAGVPDSQARQKLMSFVTDHDEFHIGEREIYWLSRKKMSESEFSGALLETTLGMQSTLRNINTIKKMILKYS